ncbi:MAG: hypothetical protein IH945_12640 [Armatimonadetes bacterium]|nr:hypothetical protein [Armatimonadota bacterium]
MIRAVFQFLLALAKLFTSAEALWRLVKFAWALLLRLLRRRAFIAPVLATVRA